MRFFFNDTATTEIYTLSLHDALPILQAGRLLRSLSRPARGEHGQARRLQAAEHSGGLLARRREEPHAHQGLRYGVADGEGTQGLPPTAGGSEGEGPPQDRQGPGALCVLAGYGGRHPAVLTQ